MAFLLVVELLLHSPPDYPHSKFAWPWGFRFLVLLYSSFYGSRAQLLGSDTHGARGPSLTQTSLYMDVLVCGPLRRASCELDEASCRAHTPRGTSKAAERAIYINKLVCTSFCCVVASPLFTAVAKTAAGPLKDKASQKPVLR